MKTGQRKSLVRININRSPDQILNEKKEEIRQNIARHQKVIELVQRVSGRWRLDERKLTGIMTPVVALIAFMAWLIVFFAEKGSALYPYRSILTIVEVFAGIVTVALATARFWTPKALLLRRLRAMGVTYALDTGSERSNVIAYTQRMINELRTQHDGLTLESTIPPLYFETIEGIRKDILGPDSRLLKAERQLLDRAGELNAQTKQIETRLQDAWKQGDSKRIPMLRSAHMKALARFDSIIETHKDTIELINNIDAALTKCENRVRHFTNQLGDVDLIRKMEEKEEADAEILAETRLAMEEAAAEIEKQIYGLHEKIATMASDPKIGGKDEDLEDYLDRIEEVSAEITEILAPKLLPA